MNRQIRIFVCVGLLVTLVALTFPSVSRSAATLRADDKQTAFQAAMRKLWEDHITWTRVFIISAAADLPDKAAARERLLQNQVDIGNAIKPYYGDAAGGKLTTLLKEHISTAAEVVAAAKANDKAKLDDATSAGLQMPIRLRTS
jgi:hypothetical protein